MSTSEITKELGPLYTWLDLKKNDVTWNNPSLRIKPWREMQTIHFLNAVQEDALGISDGHAMEIVNTSKLNIRLLDEIHNGTTLKLPENFGVSSQNDFGTTKSFRSFINAKAQAKKDFTRVTLTELFVLADSVVFEASIKVVEDVIRVSEKFDHAHNYNRMFTHLISMMNGKTSKSTNKSIESGLVLRTELGKKVTKDLEEILQVGENYQRRALYNRIIKSIIGFTSPGFLFHVKAVLVDTLSVHAHTSNQPFKHFEDLISLEDYAFKIVTFNLLMESLLVLDDSKYNNNPDKITKDGLVIVDELLKNSDLTISDIYAISRAITDDEFSRLVDETSPVGYGPFKPFLDGDYEYEEALIRIAMLTSDRSRPYIDQMKLEVDLPDVFARGEYTIAPLANGIIPDAEIKFERKFYKVPTVTVAMRAGTTSFIPTVEITDITTDGFKVELQNPQNNTRVGGTITWKAQGY
ncbi:MAG: hypothetical protein ABJG42_24085 [Vibrio splendidus]